MSPVAEATLFDGDLSTAVNQLMHLPETIEKLVFPSARIAAAYDHHHHRDRQQNGQTEGLGGFPVDILESPKAYTFFLDVLGLSKSDIQVTVENESVLVIRSNGKRKREEEGEEGCKYLRLDRKSPQPKFLRKFRLPEDSDPAAVSARCENGELRVAVEKRPPPEVPKPKTVEVSIA